MLNASQAFAADPATEIINLLSDIEELETEMSIDQAKTSTNTADISKSAQEQLSELKNEWEQLTKAYGMGKLYDDTGTQNARLWSANDWNDVINQAAGGNSSRFQELMSSYQKLYPSIKQGTNTNIPASQLVANSYTQMDKTNNAALATSAYTYDEVNKHIQELEGILAEVEKAPNEKAAIDLNSRLIAELGFIQLDMVKMQSVHTQMEATRNQNELSKDTLDKQFTNYKLP